MKDKRKESIHVLLEQVELNNRLFKNVTEYIEFNDPEEFRREISV